MLKIGVQTKNVVDDQEPLKGFEMLKNTGFTYADFSLNSYLTNKSLYRQEVNTFFDQTQEVLEKFFTPHKRAAERIGVTIHQMHMPYPNYVPGASQRLNDYLWNVVATKSMKICAFFDCPYIVVHGFKLARNLGSEEAEWEQTEKFLEFLAPQAKEMGITVCIENLYNSIGNHIVEGPCCNAVKASERIDRLNDKYHGEVFGFCFDTGHAKLVGLNFENFITTLDNRLKIVHIHDNDGVGDLHQIPFTFTKTRENAASTDWKGFIRGLRKIGFDSVLNFETAPVLEAFPEEMKEEALSFIARIGIYFGEALLSV